MSQTLRTPGLLAGIVLIDLLINLPGISPGSPLASLLAPSLDLLVALALLMSAAYGGQRVRTGFAAGVSVLLAILIGWEGYRRWGTPGAGRILIVGIAAVVACAAFFFLSKLVLRGFRDAVIRNLFLLAAAGCAVVQALLGVRIFAPSVVPGMLKTIGGG